MTYVQSFFILTVCVAVIPPAALAEETFDSKSHKAKYPHLHLREFPSDRGDVTDAKRRLSIEIAFVTPLSGTAKASGGGTDALMTLIFRNSSPEGVDVPFSKIAFGKGAHIVNPPETAPRWKVKQTEKFPPYAAETSLVNYQWFDSTEKCVVAEQVFITNDSLAISANGYNHLHLPIKLPTTEGTYRIALQFDNTMVPALHAGTNNRLIDDRFQKPRYVKREASAMFALAALSKSEPTTDQ